MQIESKNSVFSEHIDALKALGVTLIQDYAADQTETAWSPHGGISTRLGEFADEDRRGWYLVDVDGYPSNHLHGTFEDAAREAARLWVAP